MTVDNPNLRIPYRPAPQSGARIVETPQSLCRRESQAIEQNSDVVLAPNQIRQIAESWHADQEKIKYLESLLVRMGRA